MEARRTLRQIIAIAAVAVVVAGVLRLSGRALAQRYPAVAAIEAIFFHPQPKP